MTCLLLIFFIFNQFPLCSTDFFPAWSRSVLTLNFFVCNLSFHMHLQHQHILNKAKDLFQYTAWNHLKKYWPQFPTKKVSNASQMLSVVPLFCIWQHQIPSHHWQFTSIQNVISSTYFILLCPLRLIKSSFSDKSWKLMIFKETESCTKQLHPLVWRFGCLLKSQILKIGQYMHNAQTIKYCCLKWYVVISTKYSCDITENYC